MTHENARQIDELFALAYEELYRLARAYFRGERPGHTLQPTALVHEAYVRLQKEAERPVYDRNHLVAITARAMRQVLIDHSRRKRALKRGNTTLLLEPGTLERQPSLVDVLDLNAALERLNAKDTLRGSIVELHFFGGLTVRETAEVLEVSERSVYRRLRSSKAWLKATLLPKEVPTAEAPAAP